MKRLFGLADILDSRGKVGLLEYLFRDGNELASVKKGS